MSNRIAQMQHPPTPPNNGAEYLPELQNRMQYTLAYHQLSTQSGHKLSEPVIHGTSPAYHQRYSDDRTGTGLGLDFQEDNYGSEFEQSQSSEANNISNYGVLLPPTPRSTTDDDSGRRTTRSKRSLVPPLQAEQDTREKAIPRSRKSKANKSDKSAASKLSAPLSVLTAHLHEVPVKDMCAYVNRSIEVRLGETAKKNGRVPRPMNSFMLYRSAYAERVKAWRTQNNHQVVSALAGESWPMEPTEIRDAYMLYAKTERENHALAHPLYKFSPSKTPGPTRKRKNEWSDVDDSSDQEDSEWMPGLSRHCAKQIRRSDRCQSQPMGNYGTRNHFDSPPVQLRAASSMTPTPWEVPSEELHYNPLSDAWNNAYPQQLTSITYPSTSMVMTSAGSPENEKLTLPQMPSEFLSNQALLGLPGGNTGSAMYLFDNRNNMSYEQKFAVDPELLVYEPGTNDRRYMASLPQHAHNLTSSEVGERNDDQHEVHGYAELESHYRGYPGSSWQSDPAMMALEQESEFEKWMGDHEHKLDLFEQQRDNVG